MDVRRHIRDARRARALWLAFKDAWPHAADPSCCGVSGRRAFFMRCRQKGYVVSVSVVLTRIPRSDTRESDYATP